MVPGAGLQGDPAPLAIQALPQTNGRMASVGITSISATSYGGLTTKR
jgi:hypothetical protein